MNAATIHFREFAEHDLWPLAKLRSGGEDHLIFWQDRITKYLAGTHNPQMALPPRVIYVAERDGQVIGFIAGQLTTRLGCQGELQWLDVDPQFRRRGVASKLIAVLAQWFNENSAYKVCVDPGTDVARQLYAVNGAAELNEHWMFWEDIRQVLGK